jgi:hypothetical protein
MAAALRKHGLRIPRAWINFFALSYRIYAVGICSPSAERYFTFYVGYFRPAGRK